MLDAKLEDVRESIPERLYHYTTLESLALILENRTIRLMPIEGMDDPQESRTSDVQNLGRFLFARSWTDDPIESIPMWNMYASLETGVRICLPSMPFRRYRLTADQYAQEVEMLADHISFENGYCETFLPPRDLASTLLFPAFMEGVGVTEGLLGKYKNEHWAFHREWHYWMIIIPFNMLDMSGDAAARLGAVAAMMIQGALPVPCPYYDLAAFDEAVKGFFEIVSSPTINPFGPAVSHDMWMNTELSPTSHSLPSVRFRPSS